MGAFVSFQSATSVGSSQVETFLTEHWLGHAIMEWVDVMVISGALPQARQGLAFTCHRPSKPGRKRGRGPECAPAR